MDHAAGLRRRLFGRLLRHVRAGRPRRHSRRLGLHGQLHGLRRAALVRRAGADILLGTARDRRRAGRRRQARRPRRRGLRGTPSHDDRRDRQPRADGDRHGLQGHRRGAGKPHRPALFRLPDQRHRPLRRRRRRRADGADQALREGRGTKGSPRRQHPRHDAAGLREQRQRRRTGGVPRRPRAESERPPDDGRFARTDRTSWRSGAQPRRHAVGDGRGGTAAPPLRHAVGRGAAAVRRRDGAGTDRTDAGRTAASNSSNCLIRRCRANSIGITRPTGWAPKWTASSRRFYRRAKERKKT